MAERNLDFDKVVSRKNTYSLKYDFAERRGMPKDIFPLWVADMDFKTSSYIQDAIIEQAERGIYGYSEATESYFEAVSNWMEKHHNWKVDQRWIIKTPGVVFALAMAVKAFTKPGDNIIIQQPVYYPFSEVITDNDRVIVDNTLYQGEDGKYYIDYEDFEKKVVDNNVKLFLLCNPHNPGGRVWTKEELERLGDICVKHGVIVVSDEIHGDIVFTRKHTVFASIKEEFNNITITCTSASKTFNIAGLQISNIFIANRELKKKFKKQVDAAGYSQQTATGIAATEAAYRYGEEWYQAMLKYVKANIDFTKQYIEKNIPGAKVIDQEGTYLVWIDFKALGFTDKELNDRIIKKANLWLDSGEIFGPAGQGFQRINVACPRSVLEVAYDALAKALV